MNLYTIGHSDWESWGTVTLQHEKLFTKEEFNDIVADAHIKAYLINISKLSKEIREEYDYYNNVEHFWEHVPQILIEDYGFQNITIVHNFYVNSMSSILEKEDHETHNEQMNLIHEKYKDLKV